MKPRYFFLISTFNLHNYSHFMAVLNIGIQEAYKKITHFCSYQERSHQEVRDKLYGFGLYKDQVEEIVMQLIQEDYLNEERYATAFAGGKFRMKGWGKVKIRYELKQNGISDYCIKKALTVIDDEVYLAKATQYYEGKLKELAKEKNSFIRRKKTQNYLLQKGYELSIINEIMKTAE